ncbi:cation diffusion facilitator family transporter [Kaistia dalseonensis]|uniref:Cation diffusion facilitator family transporter n=1 Tax=Kaistia dalseonensis TaxID=410840 RepID=A0ABU0H5Y9_9HYPH|nr:cation diffusion facilitator family transporter [Kaistia dalseonensis]MCX5494861.1 cation diffusion facilitator family transporter [Kaistia dalseonensis]MDQ0437442.1 cation diffusion facilitator family transporter [Kaistia dalseonensis]
MKSWTDKRTLVALGSIVIAVVVMALKYVAYLQTGSVALYSDALESVVNLITALAALWAIRVSNKPADSDHQFGHHKAEYFSAVLEGVLIVLAAMLIMREAWFAFSDRRELENVGFGMALNIGATGINGLWALYLFRFGRQRRSPAFIAEAWHLTSDVVSSAGVLIGLVLVYVTGWTVLDPAMAVLVALNILWSGWRVIRDSVGGLMDHAVSTAVESEIRTTISLEAEGAIEVHELRTRSAGRAIFIEFHLVVPGSMTVAAAHAICDRLEAALQKSVEGAEVLIHVEPEAEALHHGVLVL